MSGLRFYWKLAVATLAVLLSSQGAQAVDYKFSGFGSFYYAQTFSKDITPYGFSTGPTAINTNADFTHFSLIGTDLSAKFSDEWTVAAELISSGAQGAISNYSTFAEWAYVSYTPLENTNFKLGRQRYPIFTASEYVENHSQLPYREIPSIVYKSAPFSTFDGLSANQTLDVGVGKLSAGIFGGTAVLDYALPSYLDFSFSSLIGAKLTLDGDGWRVRAQASTYSTKLNYNLTQVGSPNDIKVNGTPQTYTVGYRWDKYNLVSWGEYLYSTSPDGSTVAPLPGLIPGGKYKGAKAGYVLVGYRLGDWMPRYTFAHTHQEQGVSNGSVTSHTVGVNYKFNANVQAKAEYEYDSIPSAQGGAVLLQSPTSTATSTNAVYAGVDVMF